MAVCSTLIFLSVILMSCQAGTNIRAYSDIIYVPIHGTEAPITWNTWFALVPEVEHGYLQFLGADQPYAPYLGLTIAGRAEFPWIVYVSNTDLSEELHGVGNLISSNWVATAGHLFLDWGLADECGPSESQNYQVTFCTNYLHEDFYKYEARYIHYGLRDDPIYHLFEGSDDHGVRTISSIVRHPLCTRFSREWDLMMVQLNIPIGPNPPEISFMPFWRNTFGVISIPPVIEADLRHMLCYVASYGKPYKWLNQPMNLGYKVKYRVYAVDWSRCHEFRSQLCSVDGNDIDLNCEYFFDFGSEDFGQKQLMCFEMRNFNGALCNHDQGAPVVCNGEVAAFVVRGVRFDSCKSGSPFPVVAVKIDTFQGGFFSGKQLPPMTRPPAPTTPFLIPQNNFTRKRNQDVNWQKYAPFWKA